MQASFDATIADTPAEFLKSVALEPSDPPSLMISLVESPLFKAVIVIFYLIAMEAGIVYQFNKQEDPGAIAWIAASIATIVVVFYALIMSVGIMTIASSTDKAEADSEETN